MSVRGLSIFQVFKDIKETMSGTSGNNPSGSDGPSSIFYVSAEIEPSIDGEAGGVGVDQDFSEKPGLSLQLPGNESPPPLGPSEESSFKHSDTKREQTEPDNDKLLRPTPENPAPSGPFDGVRAISTTSSIIPDIPRDNEQIRRHHPHQSQTAQPEQELLGRKSKKKFIFGTPTHWKFKNRRRRSDVPDVPRFTEEVGPESFHGWPAQPAVTHRNDGTRRSGSERSSCGSNWGGFGSFSSNNKSPRSSVSVSSDGKTSRTSSGSESFTDAFTRSFLHKLWVKKAPSSEDVSVIPSSSALVSQQLQNFESPAAKTQRQSPSDRECQSRGSQTDIHISSEHREDYDNEDLQLHSPPWNSRGLLGRVKDLHRNGVFNFGSSSGNSLGSLGNKGRSKSSSRSNSRSANHTPGRNSSSCSSSSDFYRRPSAPNGLGQDRSTDSGQSQRRGGEMSEEKNDWRKTDKRNAVRKGSGLGSVSHHEDHHHHHPPLLLPGMRSEGRRRGAEEFGDSEEEKQGGSFGRNSSEEELTSINNVGAGPGNAVVVAAAAPTVSSRLGTRTSVTMTLPRHGSGPSNPLSISSSLSDCEVASDQSKDNEYDGPFVGKALALVDCIPSPYDRHALRYKKGDVIEIISKKPTGTWTGKIGGRVGHFKFINVQVLPEEDEDEDVFPSGPDDYEGDYSRDEDYYYNNCARFTDQSDASLPRRRRRKNSLTPWQMEQRQSVASVINGLRKENALLRKGSELRSLEIQGNSYAREDDGAGEDCGPSSMPPSWSESLWENPSNIKGFPDVRRTSSREGKMRKEKKGRPKSVRDLLERINLGNYISVFILHGFESLDLFKELEEEDLDRLAIVDGADRAKILTAAELLREYDTEEEIPILTPPAPAPEPPTAPPPPAFSNYPRDSGIFVKFEEELENHFSGNLENIQNSAAPPVPRPGTYCTNINCREKENQEIILSPANLQQLQDDKGIFSFLNDSAPAGAAPRCGNSPSANGQILEIVSNDEDRTDFYGDVKQRFLNARSMFEMASNGGNLNLAGNSNPGANSKSQENLVTKTRFVYEKSDSGISCSTNSPTLVPSD